LYCIEANADDPEHESHNIAGYFISILIGMVSTAVALILFTSVIGIILLAILSLLFGALGIHVYCIEEKDLG